MPLFFSDASTQYHKVCSKIPYDENCLRKKKFTNFMNLEAFEDVFLHFLSWPEFLYMRLPEL